jgi:hypothetical protein
MLKTLGNRNRASKRKSEINEVRLLVVILFPCFFISAACRRLMPAGLPAGAGDRRRVSCFEEARRSTYSVIPYTMMQ